MWKKFKCFATEKSSEHKRSYNVINKGPKSCKSYRKKSKMEDRISFYQ